MVFAHPVVPAQLKRVGWVVLVGLFLSGCSVRVEDRLQKDSHGDPSQQERQQVDPEALLESSLELLLSPKLGPDTYRLAADRLNHYARTRGTGPLGTGTLDEAVLADLSQRLAPELMRRVTATEFDAIDAHYLATAFILKAASRHVCGDETDPLRVAELLFDWAVRSIPTTVADRDRKTPFHLGSVLLAGRGTPDERAWVFAELLRQQRLTAAVVAVRTANQGNSETNWQPWAVGVVVGQDLYLFDPWRAVPVLGPDGKVATLAQLQQQPELLEFLQSVDPNYPASSGNLTDVQLWVVGRPECWSARMRWLENQLAGRYQTVLTVDLPSVVKMLRAGGGASVRSIELWPLPHQAVLAAITGQSYRAMVEALGPVSLPPVQEARLNHLLGQLQTAREQYLELREPKRRFNLPPEAEQLRQAVREYCTFYMGQLKADEGDWEIARNWFENSYKTKYSDGLWKEAASLGAALCLEKLGRYEEAIKTLEEVAAEVPEGKFRAALLKKREQLKLRSSSRSRLGDVPFLAQMPL